MARLAVTQREAATALGVSVDFFAKHIAPELPVVRRGRLRRYPVKGLERWVEQSAEEWSAA